MHVEGRTCLRAEYFTYITYMKIKKLNSEKLRTNDSKTNVKKIIPQSQDFLSHIPEDKYLKYITITRLCANSISYILFYVQYNVMLFTTS